MSTALDVFAATGCPKVAATVSHGQYYWWIRKGMQTLFNDAAYVCNRVKGGTDN